LIADFIVFVMERKYFLVGGITLLMFLMSFVSVKAQNSKNVNDSLRTLNILKKTLNETVNNVNKAGDENLNIEIDGMVMDETLTKVGRDFYDMFYSSWVAPKNAKNYTIKIKEMVLPGLANQVTIFVDDNEVFKQKIQPRYDILEQMSKYANQMTLRYLNNYEKMKSQLDGDDQSGTGIF